MIITVITATYNRANLLRRLHESLVEQHYSEIEWIVVNDGGSDDTGDAVAEFQREGYFAIRYFRIEHQGKSVAVNTGLEVVTGDVVTILDDDDYLLPDVLSKVAEDYATIASIDEVVGLSYLTVDQQGTTWGRKFPQGRMISDHYQCRVNGNIWGDKCEFTKARVLRENYIRYATGGTKFGFGGETIFFLEIAERGNTLYVNLPVLVKEYRIDGLSVNWRRKSLENPSLAALYYAAHLNSRVKFWIRLRYMVAYLAIVQFAGYSIDKTALRAPWNRLLFYLAYLPGAWFGKRWKGYKKRGYPLSTHWMRPGN